MKKNQNPTAATLIEAEVAIICPDRALFVILDAKIIDTMRKTNTKTIGIQFFITVCSLIGVKTFLIKKFFRQGFLTKFFICSQTFLTKFNFDGRYKWIAFLPSKTHPRVSELNLYFLGFKDAYAYPCRRAALFRLQSFIGIPQNWSKLTNNLQPYIANTAT